MKSRASAIIFDVIKFHNKDLVWLLPANCCPIVPLTFLKADVKFELIDIDYETLCLDTVAFFEKVNHQPAYYGGLLFVETYGAEINVSSFFKEIKSKFPLIVIIYDKCSGFPFGDHDEFADVTLYSTGYAKCVDLTEGGYGIINENFNYTHQKELPYNADDLVTQTNAYKKACAENLSFPYTDSDWLCNSKLNISDESYFATISIVKSKSELHKKNINQIYSSLLPKEIQLQEKCQQWRFNILVENKDELLKSSFSKKLFASSLYHSLGGVFSRQNCKNAALLHKHIINLFNDVYIKEDQAKQLCTIITEHYSKYGGLSDNSPLTKILINKN